MPVSGSCCAMNQKQGAPATDVIIEISILQGYLRPSFPAPRPNGSRIKILMTSLVSETDLRQNDPWLAENKSLSNHRTSNVSAKLSTVLSERKKKHTRKRFNWKKRKKERKRNFCSTTASTFPLQVIYTYLSLSKLIFQNVSNRVLAAARRFHL